MLSSLVRGVLVSAAVFETLFQLLCECVPPCVAMIIINVNPLFVLYYSCMTLLFD
jgi:hypothetical protein